MKNIIKINRLFYFSTIVIFGLSSISHFAYKWSGYNDFIGAFTPTNESIFQHIKMIFYTITLYYFITYIIFSKKYDIDGKRYFLAPLITIFLTSFIVVANYYMFKNGFNIDSMFIDISSLIIGLLLSSFISKHIYHIKNITRFSGYASLFAIFVLSITITFFQLNPLRVDFFYDNENHTYYEVYK